MRENLTEKLNYLLSKARPYMIEVVFEPSQKNIAELCLAIGQNRPEGADHFEHVICTSVLLTAVKSARAFHKGVFIDRAEVDTMFTEYTERETRYMVGLLNEKEIELAQDILI